MLSNHFGSDSRKMRKAWIYIILLMNALSKQCAAFVDIRLKETIQFFGEHYESSCITLLYSNENFSGLTNEIHWLVHRLAVELTDFSVSATTFDRFMKKYIKWKALQCNSPLIVVCHSDNGTRIEMEKVSRTRLFHMTYWLLYKVSKSDIPDFFEHVQTPFNLRLVVTDVVSNEYVDFFEVYRVQHGRPLRMYHLGYWTHADGYVIGARHIFDRRHDLEGIVLKTGSTDNYPMHYFEELPNGTRVLKGYFPEVWRELERVLNFTSVNYPSVDRVTGIPEENGMWNGLIGMLQRKEIDAAVSMFIMDRQRSHVIDFTRPLLRTNYQIFFKNMGNNFNWDAILRPFKKNIWITIGIWIVVCSVFSWVCNRYTHKYGLEKNSKKEDFNFINSGLFFTKALCNQGHYCTPSSIPSRIIFLSAYMVAAVLVPSYSAALIYFLTSRSPMRPFDSLHELLALGTYRLQTVAKTAHYTYFSNSTNPLLHRIYVELMKKIPPDELPVTMKEAFVRLCTLPHLAHFGDMANALVYVKEINAQDGHCRIMHLKREISSVYSCIGLVRDSPFKQVIDHVLHSLSDYGIIDEIRGKTYPMSKLRKKKTTWGAVESNDVFQVFVILITGMVLSIAIFILEILTARFMKPGSLSQIKAKKVVPTFHVNRAIYLSEKSKQFFEHYG